MFFENIGMGSRKTTFDEKVVERRAQGAHARHITASSAGGGPETYESDQ